MLNRHNKTSFICAILIVLQVVVVFFWADLKAGFHHDEILSFQISNLFEDKKGYNLASRKDYFSTWHDSEYFEHSLVADEERLFSLSGVCQNMRYDNHPVLFNYVLHVICSMFPGMFSKWLGIIPNILYFIVTQLTLYKIGKRIGKSSGFGLLLIAAYGFSAAAISNVIFIRMYCMMTMWAVMQIDCHLRIYEDFGKKRWYVIAGILTFLGVNTQYYFIILQFLISASCFVWMLIKHHWKKAVMYAICIWSALGVTVLFWPPIIKQIFSGNRGTEAVENLFNENNRLGEMLSNVDQILANDWGVQVLLLLWILCVLMLALRRKVPVADVPEKQSLITMIVTVSGYILIVSQIAPYSDARYAMPVLPLMVTCVLWVAWVVLLSLLKKNKLVVVSLAVMIIAITGCSYTEKRVTYLFEDWSHERQSVESYKDLAAVVVLDNAWKSSGVMVLHMREHPRTYLLESQDIHQIAEATTDCEDAFFLYIEKNDGLTENLKLIETLTNSTAERIYAKNKFFEMYQCTYNK